MSGCHNTEIVNYSNEFKNGYNDAIEDVLRVIDRIRKEPFSIKTSAHDLVLTIKEHVLSMGFSCVQK